MKIITILLIICCIFIATTNKKPYIPDYSDYRIETVGVYD